MNKTFKRVEKHLTPLESDAVARWGGEYQGECFTTGQALYWYAADYHDGQWSRLYRILSAVGYTPGAMERGPEPDTLADALYQELIEAHGIESSRTIMNMGGEL